MGRIKKLSSPHLGYYINDRDHNPPHVHVRGLGASVRVNLKTLEPMDAKTKFSASTLKKILEVVSENQILLLEEWEIIYGQD